MTVKELKDMFLLVNEDWKIKLQKWEHITKEEQDANGYWPNIVGVKVKSVFHNSQKKPNDLIYTFEESYNDFILDRDNMIDFFCANLNDDVNIDFRLSAEDGDHFLRLVFADKGYSDKVCVFNLNEH